MTLYRKIIKSLLDFTLSLIAIVILAPLLIILSIILSVYYGGSPFFLQNRPGKDCRIFRIIKFKTMIDRKDEYGIHLPDSQRLTSFGKFLRRTSLDELPQLINVIKGEMSIIGPRPLMVEYLPLYNDFQKRRHEVKPGIMGLAQAKGRNKIRWEDKFRLDVWYVDHISLKLDVKILFLSFVKSLKQEGIVLADTIPGSLSSDTFSWND